MDSMVIITGAVALILGIVVGFVINRLILTQDNNKMTENARIKAEGILEQAELKGENIKQEKISRANEKYQQLKNKFEKEANQK